MKDTRRADARRTAASSSLREPIQVVGGRSRRRIPPSAFLLQRCALPTSVTRDAWRDPLACARSSRPTTCLYHAYWGGPSQRSDEVYGRRGVGARDLGARGLVTQLLDRDRAERAADPRSEHGPQEVGAVLARGRAVAHGDALLERSLHRLEHLAKRDRGRRAGERVAAARSALARDDVVAPQPAEDLLEIARRDRLPLADHPDLHGLAMAVVGQVEHAADRILHLERKTHTVESANDGRDVNRLICVHF